MAGDWKVFSLISAAKYALPKERHEYCYMPTENVREWGGCKF